MQSRRSAGAVMFLVTLFILQSASNLAITDNSTIEVIEDKNDEDLPNDSLWGLAWGVKDIIQTRERLLSMNIEVSDIRPGVKEDTLVATISSHTNNVPTLLIEHTKKA